MTRMSLRRKTVTPPLDPRISALEDEIIRARQYRTYDAPHRSLDERLDEIESRLGIIGTGDMKRSQYDRNADGKVDYAEIADWAYSVDWSGVYNKPHIPAPYILPMATQYTLGGIKSGGDIEVQQDGTIRVIRGGGGSAVEDSLYNGYIRVDGQDIEVYRHPDNEYFRHVTDSQIQYWNAKANRDVATQYNDGLLSLQDKRKLDELVIGISEAKADEKYAAKYHTHTLVTQFSSGLMSPEDKQKLDGLPNVEAGNFVKDTELQAEIQSVKVEADSKYATKVHSHSLASHTSNGFMSTIDKQKLDSLDPASYANTEDLQALELRLNNFENGGGGVPKLEEITGTVAVPAGGTVQQSFPTSFGKFDIRTVWAKGTKNSSIVIQINEKSDGTLPVYRSNQTTEVEDIALVPYIDKTNENKLHLQIENKGGISDTISFVIKIVQLI
ncbi:hypothetical protein DFP93_101252 [Aneurinibacillus soli]|uniref:Uncharacterized protein n=1 Tax=Aneurinibacillus soli TaxID=1500254 RepID=A0A0U5B455_9BACL|nr:hypothetical protein [Aneurinibacillus soli]PYE64226.1 hypothetical protein DFP93_101252 [Aneurinibacillus soli]BAU28175.1 hypothetical protein CB4_02349 [Aneurinibacillus soli]